MEERQLHHVALALIAMSTHSFFLHPTFQNLSIPQRFIEIPI